jgi:putative glutamine amidotransferase
VLIVGRLSPEAKGVRGPAFAAGQTYFRAVERAGGIPVMLPPITSLADHALDLIGDVDPRRYGEEPSAEQLYGIVPEHDEVELAVVHAALEADLPTLAICRGMQVMNVAMGGTLVQHIGSEEHWLRKHPVQLAPGSRLATAIGATQADACHSVHHQAVARLGAGLTLTATADDGMPEGFEVDDARWFVGVQWHPEDTAERDAQQQVLFDELLRQAQR